MLTLQEHQEGTPCLNHFEHASNLHLHHAPSRSIPFVSTANAFVLRSAIPVFVDIRPDTLNIDEAKIEAAITEKTRAIVPVHYAGAISAKLFRWTEQAGPMRVPGRIQDANPCHGWSRRRQSACP